MRLAWFSPWPPQRSGVARCSADVVPPLAARQHAIDVFVDAEHVPVEVAGPSAPSPGIVRVVSAHDFIWRHARRHYDLVVYQVGNSTTHAFIWPYLFRYPGLVVLHDARLHHARAHRLLSTLRFDEYRAEFRWNQPDVSPDLAEAGVHGLRGAYYYEWPMRRAVIASARLVASHARCVVSALRDEYPNGSLVHIALGHGSADLDASAARRRFRAVHQLPESAPVFGTFGALTAEKRLMPILRAFAATRAWSPDARLLLVGRPDPDLDLAGRVRTLGLDDAVTLVDGPDAATFDDAIAACDVGLNLRWPTAEETSGPWLRCLAAGRATVVIDLAHQRGVPTLDPRTWRRHAPTDDLEPNADARAVAVAIDILDEDHSLRLAMRRLATDADLRARLGAAARRYWDAEHTVSRMTDDYEHALHEAFRQPLPDPHLPEHLSDDGAGRARAIVDPFGVSLPW
jgi:glycosyltransferase involved in cell wall biosynthesis